VSSRPRRSVLLAAAGACLIIVGVLAVLVRYRWDPLQDVDTGVGTPAEGWSYSHHAAVKLLVGIEVAFGTAAVAAYVLVLVAGLSVRGHRRAAIWTLVVMVGTSVSTTLLKLAFRRHRPRWQDPVRTLTSFSFPSGHASGIASAMGVVVVLTMLYVRSRVRRLAAFVVAAGLVVVVGADRILLGVHNLSDVLAGYALAGFWIAATLALYPPADGSPKNVASSRAGLSRTDNG